MMKWKKRKKTLFDQKNKIQGIREFALSLGNEISLYDDPISYPLTAANAGYEFQGGLVDAEKNALINKAILKRGNKLSQDLPNDLIDASDTKTIPKIDGTFLFAGVLFDHFGHFLLESLGRLWAYSLFNKYDPYILFYAPWGIPKLREKRNYIRQVLDGFGIPYRRIVFFSEISQLKTVIVPDQKYGFGLCRAPEKIFMSFIRSFQLPDQFLRNGLKFKKIYVSRSRLPFNQGRPFGETHFEKYLESNGYHILYPEKHSLYEQLAMYRSAEKIIFCDGGATYATVLLPDITAEIALIARRRDYRWNYKELTEHFVGFKKSVLWIDEVIAQYQYGLETWDAAGEIDWGKVSQILKTENFVVSDFIGLDSAEYNETKREELKLYLKSIESNPLFYNYMKNLKEQYPILPCTL